VKPNTACFWFTMCKYLFFLREQNTGKIGNLWNVDVWRQILTAKTCDTTTPLYANQSLTLKASIGHCVVMWYDDVMLWYDGFPLWYDGFLLWYDGFILGYYCDMILWCGYMMIFYEGHMEKRSTPRYPVYPVVSYSISLYAYLAVCILFFGTILGYCKIVVF
jgi:hypothetical protein